MKLLCSFKIFLSFFWLISCHQNSEENIRLKVELKVDSYLLSLAGIHPESEFINAIRLTNANKKLSKEYIVTFVHYLDSLKPGCKYADYFQELVFQHKISPTSDNKFVLKTIQNLTDSALFHTKFLIQKRIESMDNRFWLIKQFSENYIFESASTNDVFFIHITSANILPAVLNVINSTGNIEFRQTYEIKEIFHYFSKVNDFLFKEIESVRSSVKNKNTNYNDTNPLFSVLQPNHGYDGELFEGSVVGYSCDTALVNQIFERKQVKDILPADLKLAWEYAAFKTENGKKYFNLHAIRISSRNGEASLNGSVITNAVAEKDQYGNYCINLSMNNSGSKRWAGLTSENLGRNIAIMIDNVVFCAPRVMSEIKNGKSQITGNYSEQEAEWIAAILKTGKLMMPARIKGIENQKK